MRRLFEAAARVLRDRREMTVAVATAIVAVILIGGGQGDLAAIVALGAAGLMAGRAEKNRLAARDARRQVDELRATALRWPPGGGAARGWSKRPENTWPL